MTLVAFFGLIHGGVGVMQQQSALGSVVWTQAGADAGLDMDFMAFQVERLIQGLNDFFRNGARVLGISEVLQ